MRLPRLIALLSGGMICVAVGLPYMLWHRDHCAQFFRLTRRVDALEWRRSRYSLADRVVGVLHGSSPLSHYRKELAGEIKDLTASGELVEFMIPCGPGGVHSEREIGMAALAVHRRTGAEYWIDLDRSNRMMVVVCRSQDSAAFSAALK